MAPPRNRRSGFSRRAQFGLFIGYVAAVGGALIALLLLAVSIIDPTGFAALRGAALDVTAPVSRAGSSVAGFFGGIGDGVSNYFRAGSQNAQLQADLAEARRELNRRMALEHENRRLHALLGLARETTDEVTVARIVGSSFDAPRRLATLSAGTTSGVAPGQPVRSPDGLIGRVLETGRWASRILLVTDGASNVPVRLVRDGTPALAVGRGDGTIELRTLEVGQSPFRRGDVLVTSGVGGIFPPNIPVAIVTTTHGDSTQARPIADPAGLDYAIVQRAYQPAANGSLELAPQSAPAPPVAAPPPGSPPAPGPRLQNNPRYQPGLQQPQPGNVVPTPGQRPQGAAPAAEPRR
jgi:rod shape-determining protein MreC